MKIHIKLMIKLYSLDKIYLLQQIYINKCMKVNY